MTEIVLASWSDGPAKQAILDFVDAATTPGAAFVEPADRIAAFDNDGTLWVEQPIPPQFDFVFRKWEEEVRADPSLAQRQPYKALIEKDLGFFEGVATQDPRPWRRWSRGSLAHGRALRPRSLTRRCVSGRRRSNSRSSGCRM